MSVDRPLKPVARLLIASLVLAVLLAYSFARFFVVPYIGFQFSGSDLRILDVFVEDSRLQEGDLLLQAGGITAEEYLTSLDSGLLQNVAPGEAIHLVVERDGLVQQIDWRIPGFNTPEFVGRLVNSWWLSYAFWLTGTVILFFVRPPDRRWVLLVAFNFVTAIWFMAGAQSTSGVYASGFVFRAGIWLSLPIYLHLHWVFPRRWRPIPPLALILFYSASVVMAFLQLAGWLPMSLYLLPMAVAVLGSILMLLGRLIFSKSDRRDVGFLLLVTFISLVPSVVAGVLTSQRASTELWAGTVFSLFALPGAYLYVVARRQLGGLELRANRLISLYLFFVILLVISLVTLPLLSPILENPSEVAIAILVTGVAVTLFSVFGFARFQRFVERRLLGIPLPPEGLAQDFASRISTSFELEHLTAILQQEVLPSLLIRQSALVLLEPRPAGRVAYLQGVGSHQLPGPAQLAQLPTPLEFPGLSWVQVAVAVQAGGVLQAAWLLGRKDPDDYYSYEERRTLASLADQMGIALVNIEQKSSLRALYQQGIDRQESHQAHLARELHDDVLQEVNVLFRAVTQQGSSAGFLDQLHSLNDRIRQLIQGLRPAMLDFGLYRALSELVDDLTDQHGDQMAVLLQVPESAAEYDPRVTEHIYRIVQQAANNAVKHSQASMLAISGRLEPGTIELQVEDDGVGFERGKSDLAGLLLRRSYGLAGMSERAALIGAALSIDSAPGQGTLVHLYWQA